MSNVNQTGRCFRVFLSASPALSDPSRQRGPCQLQQVMLARAAIRNSLPHLAMTTLPIGRLGLAVAEPIPKGWDGEPAHKIDWCNENHERRGGIRSANRCAAGRGKSREWVVGFLG